MCCSVVLFLRNWRVCFFRLFFYSTQSTRLCSIRYVSVVVLIIHRFAKVLVRRGCFLHFLHRSAVLSASFLLLRVRSLWLEHSTPVFVVIPGLSLCSSPLIPYVCLTVCAYGFAAQIYQGRGFKGAAELRKLYADNPNTLYDLAYQPIGPECYVDFNFTAPGQICGQVRAFSFS